MVKKLEILGELKRDELLALVDRFGVEVPDRRSKDGIVEALAGSRKVVLAEGLADLSRDRLKELCRALGLDDGGREKAVLVERLTGGGEVSPASPSRPPASVRPNGKPVAEVAITPGESLTLDKLERHLWSAADILRGSIDSSDYKNFIFGLLFLKRLSDRFDEECEAIVREGGDAEDRDEHEFFVPPRARWKTIQKAATGIGEVLNKACAAVEEENARALEGVLLGMDFNDERKLGDAKQRDSVLARLVQHFSLLDLRNANLSEPDMLGRAYEYLIERFADDAGKKGGEFYTPRKVVQLIVELLEPKEGMRICDPTCGSGGMLIECAAYVAAHGGNPRNLSLYGQEKNLGTWSIAKLNMLLHGIKDFRIEKGDTIRDPKLVEGAGLMLFDRVIANPPFSLDEWGREVAERDPWGRFRYGVPPKDKGDLAFVEHMLATLRQSGSLAVVLPHGALSRSGAEAEIRRGIVEDDLLDAVIGLPTDLFYGAGIPAAILVLSRERSKPRRGRVIFVDASRHYRQGPSGQNHLGDEDVARIVSVVRGFQPHDKLANVVSTDDVRRAGYDLTVRGFVNVHEVTPALPLADAARVFERGEDARDGLRATLREAMRAGVEVAGGLQPAVLGEVLSETHERAGSQVDLPVLSVTKTRGLMLASDRFGKRLYSADLSRYRVARRGQLVIDPMLLWDGAAGLQRIVDAGLVSPDYRVFDVIGDHNPDYVEFLLRSDAMRPRFRSGARGTNVRRNRVTRDFFNSIQIRVPSPNEQARIATHLRTLVDLVQATEAQVRAAVELRRSAIAAYLAGAVVQPGGAP
jgi:type I restriction enzyme M protein